MFAIIANKKKRRKKKKRIKHPTKLNRARNKKPHSYGKHVMNACFSFTHSNSLTLSFPFMGVCMHACTLAYVCTLIQETKWKRYWSDYILQMRHFFIYFSYFSYVIVVVGIAAAAVAAAQCRKTLLSFLIWQCYVVAGAGALTNYVSFFVDGFMEMTPFSIYL